MKAATGVVLLVLVVAVGLATTADSTRALPTLRASVQLEGSRLGRGHPGSKLCLCPFLEPGITGECVCYDDGLIPRNELPAGEMTAKTAESRVHETVQVTDNPCGPTCKLCVCILVLGSCNFVCLDPVNHVKEIPGGEESTKTLPMMLI